MFERSAVGGWCQALDRAASCVEKGVTFDCRRKNFLRCGNKAFTFYLSVQTAEDQRSKRLDEDGRH